MKKKKGKNMRQSGIKKQMKQIVGNGRNEEGMMN